MLEREIHTPLVSVTITSYNHEKYIIDCLNGIYNQDYSNFEVIIRDDGSTDNTPALIREFINNKNNIKKIHTIVEYGENIGLIKSLNWLENKTSGDIIMGCAADDIFLPNKIKYTVEIHERYKNVDLFSSNALVISDDGELIRESFYLENETSYDSEIIEYINIEYKLAMNLSLGGFGISYNKCFLKPIGYQYPETLLFEDGYMSFLAAVQNGAIVIKKPLMKYRRASNSMSRIDAALDNLEILKKERIFLQMKLSLESNKFDYLRKNHNVNEIIQRYKGKALRYIDQKILIIKIKINAVEKKNYFKYWFKLFLLFIRGPESLLSLKILILSLSRKNVEALVISDYKSRALILG